MTKTEKDRMTEMRKAGATTSEIARTLGLSANTVKSALRRNKDKQNADEHISVCKQCGKQVRNIPHRKPHSFCSNECRNRWWNSHRSADRIRHSVICICEACGREFKAYEKRHRKFCCRECYVKARYGAGERDD